MQTAAMVERNHLMPADFLPLYLLPSTHSKVTADSTKVTSQPENIASVFHTASNSTRPLGFVNKPAPFITDLIEDEWATLPNEAGGERLFEVMEERLLDVIKSFVREYVPAVLGFIVGGPSLVVCCLLVASGTPVACIPLPLLVAIVSTLLFQAAIWLDPLKMLTPMEMNCFGKNIV